MTEPVREVREVRGVRGVRGVRMVRWVLSAGVGAALAGAAACGGSPSAPTPPPPPGAPAITCPADVSVTTATATTVVTYTAPTTTGGSVPTTVSCDVASGASLPVGTTAVTCRVTDAIGRTTSCGFTITLVLKVYVRYTSYLAFGDSLTAGEVSTSSFGVRLVQDQYSYPTVLRTLLAARYTSQTSTVVNEGGPGNLAGDDTSRLRDLLRAGPVPDVLMLLEGSNEMYSQDPALVAEIVPVLREDILLAKSMGVKQVLLATFPPARPGSHGSNVGPFIVPTNISVRDLARELEQQGVVLVDLYAAMVGQEQTLVGDDGLHLTIAGYQKMAETFFEAIKSHFELASPPSSAFSFFRR